MKRKVIAEKRNFFLTLLALLPAFPIALLQDGPIAGALAGLVLLAVIQYGFNLVVRELDYTEVGRDREKAMTRFMNDPASNLLARVRYGPVMLVPTQDLPQKDHSRLFYFSWGAVLLAHFGNAILVEDALGYAGPIHIDKYYPLFIVIILLALLDIFVAHRRKKNLFK